MKKLYEILEVSEGSTKQEIRKAYLKLAVRYHPDKNPSPEAKDRFSEISHAYEILMDDQKRAQYSLGQNIDLSNPLDLWEQLSENLDMKELLSNIQEDEIKFIEDMVGFFYDDVFEFIEDLKGKDLNKMNTKLQTRMEEIEKEGFWAKTKFYCNIITTIGKGLYTVNSIQSRSKPQQPKIKN